ncbi:MAG: glutamate 5-kinase [Polyangiaceae bacterium]
MTTARAAVAASRRVIVKIGSRAIAGDPSVVVRLAAGVAEAKKKGKSCIVVSSGAIALGTKKLGFRSRPREMAKLQAAAAAGQSVLVRSYEDAFAARGISVAQVLLTHSDLADRTRGNNARAALEALLECGAVPVLNENDSVAVDEIKFGDNDQLAAMVTSLVGADLLVLLSDVEGLLDASGKRVRAVDDIARASELVRTSKSDVGTGGMTSKLEAARRATLAGAHVVVASAAQEDVLQAIFAGSDVGTHFPPARERLTSRKHWIAFTLRPRGDIVLDEGATLAVRTKGKSVLAVGVLGIRGDFREGDAVRIVDPSGAEIGRGLAGAAAPEAARSAGRRREEGETAIEIVHRDDLVVWK